MLQREAARNDLERAVDALVQTHTAAQLQALATQLSGSWSGPGLATLPPVAAAARFRDAVLAVVTDDDADLARLREAVTTASGTEPLPPRFERAFFVFGIRRGGNHALANWLLGMLGERQTLHLNSAEPSYFRVDGDRLTVDRDRYRSLSVDPEHTPRALRHTHARRPDLRGLG